VAIVIIVRTVASATTARFPRIAQNVLNVCASTIVQTASVVKSAIAVKIA